MKPKTKHYNNSRNSTEELNKMVTKEYITMNIAWIGCFIKSLCTSIATAKQHRITVGWFIIFLKIEYTAKQQ